MRNQFTRHTLADRYWPRVRQSDGCWEWTGKKTGDGYGCFIFHEKQVAAHRVSWEIHFGPIPDGLLVLHRCDNPPCSRPDHLFLGTNSDNARDREAKGRGYKGPGGTLPHKQGSAHGRSKLTEDQVVTIRSLRKSGATYAQLAKMFGVGGQTIQKAATGLTWRHVAM